jgi:hypothetical protein
VTCAIAAVIGHWRWHGESTAGLRLTPTEYDIWSWLPHHQANLLDPYAVIDLLRAAQGGRAAAVRHHVEAKAKL